MGAGVGVYGRFWAKAGLVKSYNLGNTFYV